MIPSIQKRNEQVTSLADYFREKPDGEEFSWLRIESDTDVHMDRHGKDLVRRALQRLKRPYEAVRSIGIRLSSADSAMTIMGDRFTRIDNSVRKADRTRAHLTERHFDQMGTKDKEKMLVLAGFFGAVRTFAKEASTRLLKSGEG